MVTSVDPVLIGLFDGDIEEGRVDGARTAFEKINSNEQNLKATADAAGGAFDADAATQITPSTPIVLDAATGNQIALDLQYTTNKATSGNDTGLVVNQIDTASPGTSLLADFQAGGVSKFKVDNAGVLTLPVFSTDSNGLVLAAGKFLRPSANNQTLNLISRTWTVAGNGVLIGNGVHSNSSGFANPVYINSLYNQSSTASATDLLINRTETAVGSGAQLLQDWQVGGVSQASMDNGGVLSLDSLICATAFTVAGLPAGTVGQVARITDGDAALAWGATAVNSGAGATPYLCWYNGTNWTIMGK